MGVEDETASATPQKLFDYSKITTGSAGLLQEFVRGTLDPAVSAYQAGAIDFGGDILSKGSGYTPGAPATINEELTTLLVHIIDRDRHVALVGKLFLAADSGPQLNQVPFTGLHTVGPRWLGPDPSQIVQTTNRALEQANSRVGTIGAGQALALRFNFSSTDMRDFAPELRELAKHQDDEAFCAEFFNSLPPETIADLLVYGEPALHALAAAYASGLLKSDVSATVVRTLELLEQMPSSNPAPAAILNALASDPAGAAQFARYLTGDQKALKALMEGLGYGRETMPGYSQDAQTGSQKAYLNMLSSAVSQMAPADVRRLVEQVGANFPALKAYNLGEGPSAPGILPELQHFMAASAAAMAGPLPTGPGDLSDWVTKLGEKMRSFDGIYEHIAKIYEEDGKNTEEIRNLMLGVGLAVAVEFILPEGIGAGVVLGGLKVGEKLLGREALVAWVSELAKGAIYSHLPWPKIIDGKDAATELTNVNLDTGILVIYRLLYANNMITHQAGTPDLPDPTGPDGAKRLFEVLRHENKVDPAMSEWARQQKVGNLDLRQIFNDFLGPAATRPQDPLE